MKKNILWCGLAIYLSLLALFSNEGLAQKLSLDSLIAEALRANPDLKSAESRYKAFEAKIPQAGSFPNPMFQAKVSNLSTDTWSLGKGPMSGTEFMLSQTIPFPGKLRFAKNATLNLAQKIKEDYLSARNFILSELKQNYYQLYLLHKSIGITQENKKLLEDFARIAQTKYSVGKGLQQDVLKAQVEVSKMIDELISLEEMRKTIQAKINVLLNRNPQEELAEPEELAFRQMDHTEEELQTLALQSNPAIKGMEYSVNASQYEYKLARREYWPDFAFSLSYMHMKDNADMDPSAEKDFLSGSVSIEIPLYFWTKERKMVQEKKYELESSLSQYQGMKNDLKFDVSMLYYSLNRHQKEIELYNTAILPQARQSLESARSGYQVDKVDFLTLLDNQITLYSYQITYYQALSSYFQAIARLEEMVGESLF